MMPSVIPVLWLVILHALPIAPADKGTHCVIPCGTKHPIGMHFSDTARLVVTIVGVGVGELKIQDAKETRARGRSSALQSLAPVIANELLTATVQPINSGVHTIAANITLRYRSQLDSDAITRLPLSNAAISGAVNHRNNTMTLCIAAQ